MNKQHKGYALALLGGFFWGFIALFSTMLLSNNLSVFSIAFFRMLFSFIFLYVIFYIYNRKLLKVNGLSIALSILVGVFSQAGTNIFFYKSIQLNGPILSILLLSLAPIFASVWTWLFLKERLHLLIFISFFICFFGIYLIVNNNEIEYVFNYKGIIIGMLSGICWSSFPIFIKLFENKINSITILIYSYLGASVSLLFFIQEDVMSYISVKVLLLIVGFSFIATALGDVLFTLSIRYISPFHAGLFALIEAPTAVVIGFLIQDEVFSMTKLMGIVLFLFGIVTVHMIDHYKKELMPK